MKKITFWLFVLFGCLQMQAQLFTIENCALTLSTTTYGPMYSVATANATSRTAVVYQSSKLVSLAGQTLTSVYFSRLTATGSMAGTPNYRVYLKEVPFTDFGTGALDWATATTGAVLVYDSNPATAVGSSVGWKSFPFSTNFLYSGTQNLAVFFEYTNATASALIAWEYEYNSPCVDTENSNTTKYTNNTTGVLPATLASGNYRRPMIGFDYLVACPAPTNLVVSDITATSASVNWIAGGLETQWEYAVVPAGSGIPTTTSTIGTNQLSIAALNPATPYQVFLRAYCGTDDESVWKVSEAFTTQCVEVTSLVENFDSYTTGTSSMPLCWSKIGTGTAYVTTGGISPGSAPNRFYLNTSATTFIHAISPAFSNLSANTHRLKFKAYASTASKNLQVGYQTDLLDASTFVLLETLNLPGTVASSAGEFVVEPFDVPTSVKNLVLRSFNESSTAIYIDDIIWEPIPTCPDVTEIKYTNLFDATVTINWLAGGTETAWQYAYGTSDLMEPSTLTPVDIVTTTANVTGLLPSTSYKAWVRSNCTTGGFGAWIGPVLFTTQCSPVTDFYENFDSSVSGSTAAFTDCWQKAGNGTVYITTGGAEPGTAPNRLYMLANGTATTPTEALAIMPQVSNLQAETHRLKFKAYCSTTNKTIEVGYLQNLTDLSSFVALEQFNLPGTTAATAEEFMVEPYGVPTGVSNLVFRNNAPTGSSTIYIDDVVWEVVPACSDIAIVTVTDFNSVSATVTWEPGGSETAWQYVYAESTVTDPTTLTGSMVTVTNNPTTMISGLTAATTYNFWIRSKCGTTDFGNWPQNPTQFTTTCAPVTAFTENFDSSATGTASPMPTCWTKFGNTGTTYVNTGSTTPNSAPNRLYMYASATTSTTSIAVLPPVSNLQAGTHRLKFKAYATTSGKEIEIGYYEYAGMADSFVPLQSLALPSTAQSSATDLTYTPEFIPAGIESLVLRNNAISFTGTTAIYIDDVIWEPLPACFDITAVQPTVLSSSAADVTWVPGGSETAWQYVYAESTVTDPTTLTPTDVTNNPFASITNLTSNTTYKIWIRSNCGSGALGNWSTPFTFKTDCESTTAFSENFDSYATGTANPLPDCWKKAGNGSTYISTGGAIPGTPPNRLYMSASGTTPTVSMAIMPAVSNLQAGTHRLKFKAYASTLNKSVEIGYLTDSDDVTSFEILASFELPGTAAATAASFSYMPVNVPAGITYMAFRNVGFTGGTATMYIDDVVWEMAPSCPDLNAIQFNGSTSTTAVFSWSPGGSETDWQYVYGLATITDPTTLTPVDVSSTPSATLSDLLPSTAYNVWVRANCGAETGIYSSPLTFETACVPIAALPWTEGFEGTTGTAYPPCWVEENGDFVTSATNNYVIPRTGTRYLRDSYSATNEYMWTPGFVLSAGTSYDFSFYMAGDGYSGWTVDVYFNTVQHSTGATPLGSTITAAGPGSITVQPYSLVNNSFTPTATGTYYFAVKVNQPSTIPWYIGFDDFKLEVTPSCPTPTAPTASSITVTSATMNWAATTSGTANGYAYLYTTDLVTLPTETTVASGTVAAGITTADLSGLTGATVYKMYVRSICGGTDIGSWSDAGTFTTNCLASTLPYTLDFESVTVPNLPSCTAVENAGTGAIWQTQAAPGYGFTTKVLSYSYNSSPANAWFYTNKLSLVGGTTYTISYNYGTNSTATWFEKLRVSFGTSANATAMTTEIADHPMIQQGTLQSNSTTFTPATSGEYVIGFQAYSDANQYYLYLDNIIIQQNLSSNPFEGDSFTAYPNPVKNMLNLSYTQNISDVSVFNLLGQQVLTKSLQATKGQVDMSHLASGTYLIKVTTGTGVKTLKVIKE
ncbi:fibronectin type III domain-containing protein [Flavobacterium sp. SM2513]|uniref:fibronectin type III domain-containing protein n=1 Tax=Flavobacterium sp. SM2513 TaxID=3424766 RepID=UPI003D7F5E74